MNSLQKDVFHILFTMAAVEQQPHSQEFVSNFIVNYNALQWMLGEGMPDLDESKNLFEQVAAIQQLVSCSVCDEDALVVKYFTDDIPPSSWGPPAWRVLFTLITVFPFRVKDVLEAWCVILPCEKCRHHLKLHMQQAPLHESAGLVEVHHYVQNLHDYLSTNKLSP